MQIFGSTLKLFLWTLSFNSLLYEEEKTEIKKIPHTRDTESLNVVGQQHPYQNKQKQTERKELNIYIYIYIYYGSHVRCQLSHVTCCVSPINCHLSPVTNANSYSHRPSPCKLPHSSKQAGLQRPKNPKCILDNKIIKMAKIKK